MNERENGEHACQGVPFIPLITLFFSRFLCIPFISHLSVISSLSLSRTHDVKRTLFVPRPDPYVPLVRIRHFVTVVCVVFKTDFVHKLNCVTAFKLCSVVTLSSLTRYCSTDDGENTEKLQPLTCVQVGCLSLILDLRIITQTFYTLDRQTLMTVKT